ncbi:MAG: tRNA preQ1(34) S-adenosylmethionine ribosyltransferase-isomerase QueA [Candidatus Omnitrophota bacterium]|nr:tRNA preQ1(34) S-adenosylmethionine ribosyltransferase-isomerase QueA [Candidatus Omnitrophota bacterium]
MKLSEFYYNLPEGLIAQEPLKERDGARMMVVDRVTGDIAEKIFRDITGYFRSGDCLVLNDTRVIPARLYGRRTTGGKVEIFLLDTDGETQRALVRPSRRVREGEKIEIENGILATVQGQADVGRYVKFDAPVTEVLKTGHVPLPPYVTREEQPRDKEDYQTVFAQKDGATASPTAGLHFTTRLLNRITEKGVSIAYVTLHTSYGTFAPVKEENIEEHVMHAEHFEIDNVAAETVNRTKASGGAVFAAGTTSARALESSATEEGEISPSRGKTNLFIYPGYKFKIISGLVTNFHLPESTLLMLVSALAGRGLIIKAYKRAIDSGYRFFSYGDAMLIL